MATVSISDSGKEVTVGTANAVDTAIFLVPANDWVIYNTGNKDIVVNFDAATAPTRTQPVGDSGRYLPPGASAKVPPSCYAFTYQNATDGETSKMLITKG
jgi:hypothetical protein